MSREFKDFVFSQQIENVDRGNKIYYLDERIFQIVYKPEVAYWIGFLMADGSIQGNGLALCLGEKDLWHLKKFKKFLKTDRSIRRYEYKKTGQVSYSLAVASKKMICDLRQYGIIPRKTGREQLKNIPHEYIRDFILGYFDGDGCIYRGKRGAVAFSIASSYRRILEIIQKILMEECNLNKTKIYERKDGVKILTYGGERQIELIYNYLYEKGMGTIDYLERKKDKFLK